MLISIDYASDIPMYQQIRNQIVMAIANGRINEGDKLPTVRVLANEFGINAMTVSKAYQLLKQEGYISTTRSKGTVVIYKSDKNGLSIENMKSLEILISEAKLKGVDKEEFLKICSKIYEGE